MKCAICGMKVVTIDEAIQKDWLPYFYEGEREHGPACASCAETLICVGDDGEIVLKPEYCGKLQYLDEDYAHQSEKDLMIEIFVAEERNGPSH